MSSGLNIVAHNLQGMYTNRQLGIVNNKKAKSAEKLSTGYKINRAADDAAGLSISEKMRRQIRGLSQGTENAQDGVSVCQIADGALAEVGDMLHRITELSVKSANGTNSPSDRQDIQSEINEILEEIDRVSNTTKFNELYLFKGERRSEPVYEKSAYIDNDYVDTRNNMISNIKNHLADANDTTIHVNTDGATIKNIVDWHRYYSDYFIYDGVYELSNPISNVDYIIDGDVTLINSSASNLNFIIKSGSLTLKDSNIGRVSVSQGNNTIRFEGNNSINGICMEDNSSLLIEGNGTLDVGQSTKVSNGILGGSLYQVPRYNNSSVTLKSGNINLQSSIRNRGAGTYDCTLEVDQLNICGANVSVEHTGILHNKTISDSSINISDGALIAISPDGNDPMQGYDITVADSNINQTGGLVFVMSGNEFGERWSTVGHGVTGLTDKKTLDDRNYYLNIDDSYFEKFWKEKTFWDDNRIWIQSGADNSDDNGMYLEIGQMNTEVLGLKGLDASTINGTRDAIGRMEPALLKLNNIRSKIGAQQNRLEHTIKNQLNVVENTQASESLIRDADMADEMVKFSKEEILQQAGQSMLSQANQANQGVLSLLQ